MDYIHTSACSFRNWNSSNVPKADGLNDDNRRFRYGGRPQSLTRKPDPILKVRRYNGASQVEKFVAGCLDKEMFKDLAVKERKQRRRLFETVPEMDFIENVLAVVEASKLNVMHKFTPHGYANRFRLLVRKPNAASKDVNPTTKKLWCATCNDPYNLEKRRPPLHFAEMVYDVLPRHQTCNQVKDRESEQSMRSQSVWDARVCLAVTTKSKRLKKRLGSRKSSTELYKHIVQLDD